MIVSAFLAILLGLLLGLLPTGGSMIAVPVFRYGMEKDPSVAFPGALLVIGIASLVGTIVYARDERMRWAEGCRFAGLSMLGAFPGGLISSMLPTGHMLIFAAALLWTGWHLLSLRRESLAVRVERGDHRTHLVLLAVGLGMLTGFLAMGGGVLVVSALVLTQRLDLKQAMTTSLPVVTVNAFAGLFGHLTHQALPWGEILWVSGLAGVGVVGGVALALRIRTRRLRDALGWLVLGIAVWVLAREMIP